MGGTPGDARLLGLHEPETSPGTSITEPSRVARAGGHLYGDRPAQRRGADAAAAAAVAIAGQRNRAARGPAGPAPARFGAAGEGVVRAAQQAALALGRRHSSADPARPQDRGADARSRRAEHADRAATRHAGRQPRDHAEIARDVVLGCAREERARWLDAIRCRGWRRMT